MIDDRGFSFTVAEVKDMLRLQGQWRREEGERAAAARWAERVIEDGKFRRG